MTTEQKFFKLERTNRHWRWLAGSLGLVLVAIIGVGAAQEAPKELVLEKLTIKSAKGEAKIILFSGGDEAAILVVDAKGKTRISASTYTDGQAVTTHRDAKGGIRITAGTYPDGTAGQKLHRQRWTESRPQFALTALPPA